MSFQKVAWASAWVGLLAITASDAQAAGMRFDVLQQQSMWQPDLVYTFGPEMGPGFSIKVFGPGNALMAEWRDNYSYNDAGFWTSFEVLRDTRFRVEYRPTSTSATSIYQLSLDAPTWSAESLPLSRPTFAADPQVGHPLAISWPVYPDARGDTHLTILQFNPFSVLYDNRVNYTTGTMLTGPLLPGSGRVEVDYTMPLSGAVARMDLVSGPATMDSTMDVAFTSWQWTNFNLVPEPNALIGIALALPLFRRPRRP